PALAPPRSPPPPPPPPRSTDPALRSPPRLLSNEVGRAPASRPPAWPPPPSRPRYCWRAWAPCPPPRLYCCAVRWFLYGTAPRRSALWFQLLLEMLVRLKLLYLLTLMLTSPRPQLQPPHSAPPTMTPAVKPQKAAPAA